MNVTCPECRSMFRVDPSKVPSAGVRARCSVCGGVITIGAGTSIDEEFDNGQAAESLSTPEGAIEIIEAHRPPEAPLAARPPHAIEYPSEVAASRKATPTASGALQSEIPTPVAATDLGAAPQTEGSGSFSPTTNVGEPTPPLPSAISTANRGTPALPPTAPIPHHTGARPPAFARAPLTPPASVPGIPRPTGSGSALPPLPPARAPQSGRPSGVGPLAAIRPPATLAPTISAVAPRPPESASSAEPRHPPARAPINPFLANDPNAKARRLSRALVSDLVTYFPQRRDEGIREGTLKELFREEIKKSYEEYVDQVGREFADSTTHFQDALNEILAAGRKMF